MKTKKIMTVAQIKLIMTSIERLTYVIIHGI
jgi:hypothetical protein